MTESASSTSTIPEEVVQAEIVDDRTPDQKARDALHPANIERVDFDTIDVEVVLDGPHTEAAIGKAPRTARGILLQSLAARRFEQARARFNAIDLREEASDSDKYADVCGERMAEYEDAIRTIDAAGTPTED